MRSLPTFAVTAAILWLVLLASSSRAHQSRFEQPSIWTIEELRARASERGPDGREAARQLRFLDRPQYFEFLKEMTNCDHMVARREAIAALAAIGDSASIKYLREMIQEEWRGSDDIRSVAHALAVCKDVDSIELMQRISETTEDVYKRYAIQDAVELFEHPRRDEPLIIHDGPGIRFKFLLSDIKEIRYGSFGSEENLRFSLDEISPTEFGRICHLLQQGTRVFTTDYWGKNILLFVLSDGSTQKIFVSGNLFIIEARFRDWVIVSSPELRNHLDWKCPKVDKWEDEEY